MRGSKSARLVVRDAAPADARSLAGVHHRAVTVAYRTIFPPDDPAPTVDELARDWADAIDDPDTTVMAGLIASEVIATVAVRPDPEDPTIGQLRRLHVEPTQWRRGIGGRMHDHALDRIRARGFRRAGLWVLEDNEHARAMYESRGWALVPGRFLEWPAREVRYERPL